MEVKSNVSLSYAANRREGAQQVNGVLYIIGPDNGHGRHALSLPFSLFLPLSIISTKCPYATTPMIEVVGSVRNGYLSHVLRLTVWNLLSFYYFFTVEIN